MSITDNNVFNIEIEAIEPHPHNPRKNVGDVTELADSIKQSGLLQNLTVVPHPVQIGQYRALIGHRRLAAAKQAGLECVPCVIIEDLSLAEQVAIMVAENMQRQDLTILEQVESIQLMIDLGMSVEEVSEKTGLGKSTVYKRRALSTFESAEFKKSVERGGTLQDYEKVAALKDEKSRNKVLKAIGTNNFEMELRRAQDEERKKRRCDLIESKLNEWAKKVESVRDMRVNVFRWVSFYYDIAEDDMKLQKPASGADCEYVYVKTNTDYTVYQVKPERDSEPKKTAEQIAREKAEQERQERNKKFDELENRMKELRRDFIKSITPAAAEKKIFEIGAALIKAIWYMNDQWLNVDVYKLMGYTPNEETKEYLEAPVDSEEAVMFSENTLEGILSKNKIIALILLYYVYAFNEETDRKCRNEWSGRYVGDEYLSVVYKNLTSIGYQISDEEQAYLDGTHELYVKEE